MYEDEEPKCMMLFTLSFSGPTQTRSLMPMRAVHAARTDSLRFSSIVVLHIHHDTSALFRKR
jgi:hypothetical protein